MKLTATEVKNNFGKVLKYLEVEDVIVQKNGKPVARITGYASPEDDFDLLLEGAPSDSFDSWNLSYEEYLELVENSDERYEYIGGCVYLMASPTVTHQMLVGDIYGQLFNYFRRKTCTPFVAPFDITLTVNGKKNVVQPDVGILCDMDEKTDEMDRYQGVPALVVEILSPGTRTKDMVYKLNLYTRSGIGEYWLVDPMNGTVTQYRFENEEIVETRVVRRGEPIEAYSFEGLSIDNMSLK